VNTAATCRWVSDVLPDPAATIDRDSGRRPIVVIGNPANRRVTMFCAAAVRLGLAPPIVLAYEQLLAENGLDRLESVPERALVRIESPGEEPRVQAALVRRGGTRFGCGPDECDRLAADSMEHGRIAGSRAWFAGYRDLLLRMDDQLAPRGVRWMNHPTDIAVLFDKAECQERLAKREIAVPPRLAAETGRDITNYDDLRRQLEQVGWSRVFVKLRYGSSASGVVALAYGKGKIQATTSVELVRTGGKTQLFNSLAVRRYTDERDVAAIVDALCREHVHIERWIPKAALDARTFDLRVLVIAGQVRHCVVRTSRGPITNLHLGNQRGDLARLMGCWPHAAAEQACSACGATAAAFPGCLYLGIDLAILAGFSRHAILEANAFGDLLPGVVDGGDDTYEAELKAALAS
jgi:hypothetical protein